MTCVLFPRGKPLSLLERYAESVRHRQLTETEYTRWLGKLAAYQIVYPFTLAYVSATLHILIKVWIETWNWVGIKCMFVPSKPIKSTEPSGLKFYSKFNTFVSEIPLVYMFYLFNISTYSRRILRRRFLIPDYSRWERKIFRNGTVPFWTLQTSTCWFRQLRTSTRTSTLKRTHYCVLSINHVPTSSEGCEKLI